MAQLVERFPQFAVSGLLALSLLTTCTKSEDVKPNQGSPAEYEITDVRYSFGVGDRVDTVTVQLKSLSLQNLTDAVVTQQVEIDYEQMKTSLFTVARADVLPNDLELSKRMVDIPQDWRGNNLVAYSIEPIEKFPLSPIRESKPYRGAAMQIIPVSIPPRSRMNINVQIDEHQLNCSFQALIQNKTTGQYYPLSGKWAGLLKYANMRISLSQQPL